jgi:hypothetical protein
MDGFTDVISRNHSNELLENEKTGEKLRIVYKHWASRSLKSMSIKRFKKEDGREQEELHDQKRKTYRLISRC